MKHLKFSLAITNVFIFIFQINLFSQINNSAASWYFFQAKNLVEKGDYFNALDFLSISEQNEKFKKDSIFFKSFIYINYLDNIKKALQLYNTIIKKFPSSKELALFYKGLIYFKTGQFEKSKNIFIKLKKNKNFQYKQEAKLFLKLISNRKINNRKFSKNPLLRILISKSLKRLQISSQTNKEFFINNVSFNNTVVIEMVNNIFYINGIKSNFSKLKIIGKNNILNIILNKRKLSLKGILLLIKNKNYFYAINLLNLEEYLKGVIPCEMPPYWHIEALKSQAIAARTYAYYQYLHRKNLSFDLYSTTLDQKYCGYLAENIKTNKAIEATNGLVIFNNNTPILALYNANNGGFTGDSGDLFNITREYLQAKVDPYSLNGKECFWIKKIKFKTLQTIFKTFNFSKILHIRPYKTSKSGRVVKVKIFTTNGDYILKTSSTLKRMLKLPDILFKLRVKDHSIVFYGKGFGHGLGLSQEGANVMAKLGWSYKKILKYYYPKTEVRKLW